MADSKMADSKIADSKMADSKMAETVEEEFGVLLETTYRTNHKATGTYAFWTREIGLRFIEEYILPNKKKHVPGASYRLVPAPKDTPFLPYT
tara:strand:- start:16 stop:291 length:276 start_codon:yes stop_codon:yes gene_type:complete